MALSDRDYMAERREPEPAFLRPRRGGQRSSATRTAALALLCAAIAWGAWRAAGPDPNRAGWMSAVLRALPAGMRTALHIDPAAAMRTPANGGVTLPPQAVPDRRALTRQELFPGAPDHPTDGSITYNNMSPGHRTVNRCQNAAGATSYSDGPCAPGQRVTRIEARNDINIADGLRPPTPQELAEQQRQAAQAAAQSAAVAQQTRAAHQRAATAPQINCAGLDDQIQHYDAMARQPQPASMQDWINERRKEARDQQFRLRCR